MLVVLYVVDSEYAWVALRVKDPQPAAQMLAVADG